MGKLYNTIIFIAGLLAVSAFIWYFQNIIAYVIISVVLSFLGTPLVNILEKIKIRKFSLPKTLCAAIALLIIWGIFIAFFLLFIPLVIMEAHKLSAIDIDKVLLSLNEPITNIDQFINQYAGNGGNHFSIIAFLTDKIQSLLSFGLLTNIFGTLASTIGNILIALFAITFITFFFLKDDKLFGDGILLLVPTQYETAIRSVLHSIKHLLMRYFIGIVAQMTGIFILIATGLFIVGIDIHTCIVIALFVSIINVIPYVGPLIGIIFGIALGLISKAAILTPAHVFPLIFSIFIVYLIVHLIDNIIFQPFIFSNSVKAHPLEIFLVLLLAGHFAGITGMLLAIPGYTVIRVIAKQFLNNFKLVKKLTEKI